MTHYTAVCVQQGDILRQAQDALLCLSHHSSVSLDRDNVSKGEA